MVMVVYGYTGSFQFMTVQHMMVVINYPTNCKKFSANLKVYYGVLRSPPLNPLLSQMNPVDILTPIMSI